MTYFEDRMAQIAGDPSLVRRASVIDGPALEQNLRGRLGWVYFIESGGYIKIGFATDYETRLHELQVGNHGRLYLKSVVRAYRSCEKAFHRCFSEYHVRGEWFRFQFDIDELWDDILDYKMNRNASPGYRQTETPVCMDDVIFETEDVPIFVATIGETWPRDFVERMRNGIGTDPAIHLPPFREDRR